MIKKIFAYTKDAGVTAEILEKLAEADYLPVPVENMDCIRVIEPLADAESSLVFRSAVRAILHGNSFESPRERFAKVLLTELEGLSATVSETPIPSQEKENAR